MDKSISTSYQLSAISYQLSLPARKYYRSTFIYIARLAQVPGVARGIKKILKKKISNFEEFGLPLYSYIFIHVCIHTDMDEELY